MSARPGPATSTLERGTWPWVIIGGGPSAILQVTHLLRTGTAAPSDILMIGSEWGAPGMGFLGSVRLQSYITELSLGSLTIRCPSMPARVLAANGHGVRPIRSRCARVHHRTPVPGPR